MEDVVARRLTGRYLIDECLSTALVAVAKARGLDATHILWIGKGGLRDWNLIPIIIANDDVFVTNNRRDFLRLYATIELHRGLIVIRPNAGRAEQVRLFNAALDFAGQREDLIGLIVEVFADGRVAVV